MPVRFRCVYCNQLLGISRRKAGSVVRCTSCEGQIIVPEPEARAAAVVRHRMTEAKEHQSLAEKLAEQDDLDDLLKPFDFGANEPVAVAAPTTTLQSSPVTAMPFDSNFRVKLLIGLGWAFTSVFAFAIGFALGRGTVPPP